MPSRMPRAGETRLLPVHRLSGLLHLDRNLSVGLGIAGSLYAVAAAWVLGLTPAPLRLVAVDRERLVQVEARSQEIRLTPRTVALAAAPALPAPPAPMPTAPRREALAPAARATATPPAPSLAPATSPGVAVAQPPLSAPAVEVAATTADVPTAPGPESAARAVAGGGDGPVDAATVDVPPRPLHAPAPVYPFEAQRRGVTARIEATLVVDAHGRVVSAVLRTLAGSATLEGGVREAVLQWRFAPAMFRGQAVAVRLVQPFVFEIDEE